MSTGINKTLLKLQKTVQDGNFYEAHQMYHSISQRYLKQNKGVASLNLLQEGTKEMALHGQLNSALDLAQKFIDILAALSYPVDDDLRGIMSLF
jgi:hypothetical protein